MNGDEIFKTLILYLSATSYHQTKQPFKEKEGEYFMSKSYNNK